MRSDVLIIEDLDSDFEMVSRGFRRRDKSVSILRARSVEEATSLIEDKSTPPRLIILDLRLLDGDGAELLEAFRESRIWSQSPVVVWSARSDTQTRLLCRQYSVRAYFQKVADLEIARQTVDHITDYLSWN